MSSTQLPTTTTNSPSSTAINTKNLKGKTSRVSLSTRSPTRPSSPSKSVANGTPSPRLAVRPKKQPLATRDISVSVSRILGSSAKSHRELVGSTNSIVYPAGATIVQCTFPVAESASQEPHYQYFCAPPDQ